MAQRSNKLTFILISLFQCLLCQLPRGNIPAKTQQPDVTAMAVIERYLTHFKPQYLPIIFNKLYIQCQLRRLHTDFRLSQNSGLSAVFSVDISRIMADKFTGSFTHNQLKHLITTGKTAGFVTIIK